MLKGRALNLLQQSQKPDTAETASKRPRTLRFGSKIPYAWIVDSIKKNSLEAFFNSYLYILDSQNSQWYKKDDDIASEGYFGLVA